MFPETTMSLEQQLEEVTKDLPTLKTSFLSVKEATEHLRDNTSAPPVSLTLVT